MLMATGLLLTGAAVALFTIAVRMGMDFNPFSDPLHQGMTAAACVGVGLACAVAAVVVLSADADAQTIPDSSVVSTESVVQAYDCWRAYPDLRALNARTGRALVAAEDSLREITANLEAVQRAANAAGEAHDLALSSCDARVADRDNTISGLQSDARRERIRNAIRLGGGTLGGIGLGVVIGLLLQ